MRDLSHAEPGLASVALADRAAARVDRGRNRSRLRARGSRASASIITNLERACSPAGDMASLRAHGVPSEFPPCPVRTDQVVSHGRYVTFQMAEVAVSRQMFAEILTLIARLRAPPAPSMKGLRGGKARITIGEVRFDGSKATSSSAPRKAILGFRSSRHPSWWMLVAKSEMMALTEPGIWGMSVQS
jgi:hypothetical protein